MYTVYSSCCGKRQQSSTVTCAQNISTNRVHQGRFSHAFTTEKGEAQKERLAVTLCRGQIVVQFHCTCTHFCRYYQYLVHKWKTASKDCECRKSERLKRHISE